MSHRTIIARRLAAWRSARARIETLCLLIVGVIGARTVKLGHVACERGGRVQTAST
ncbi:MAG: hypothetical protein U1E34_02245 [Amaricoccus sp.]